MKFFHDLVNHNNKRNAIVAITKENGECTTNTSQIATEFVAHFESLLWTKLLGVELDDKLFSHGFLLNGAQQWFDSPSQFKRSLEITFRYWQ